MSLILIQETENILNGELTVNVLKAVNKWATGCLKDQLNLLSC